MPVKDPEKGAVMRFILALATALCVTGCVAYTQVELADITDYAEVRVTLTDGERLQVLEPQVDADTIRGQVGQAGRPADGFAMPLEEVASIEASEPSPRHTRLLVFGIVVGTAFLLYAWVHSIFNDPNY